MPQLISRKLIAGYIAIIVSLIIVAWCGIAGMKKIGNLSLTSQSSSVQQEKFGEVQSEAGKQYRKYVHVLYILVLLTIGTSMLLFVPLLKKIDTGLKATISSAEKLKQSSEADETQGKFTLLSQIAGKVGHELRNPLGAIKNSVYYLNITLNQDQKDTKEILEIINLEIGRADKIIEDLLDYSRTRQPSRKTIVIADLLGNIIKSLKIPANIQVVENYGQNPVTFEADPDQIHSAFRNIISNAVEAMPGGGTLEITSRAYDCGVRVSVRDSGEGISDEDKTRIFEPLFTSRYGGIGLGLAIAKKHINAHNGVIEFKSKEGEGSQFDIYFPEA